jgi:hypothetical protein
MLQTSQPQPHAAAPNYHFVQNYVRDNPDMALDYLSALLRHNARRFNPPGRFTRAKTFWSDAAELATGRRLAHQRAMFRSYLDERTPLAAHVIPCIDPLHSFLFNNSAGYLFIGPRVGGALLGSSTTLTSAAAEDDLSKHMRAPVIIAAAHFDRQLLQSGTGRKSRYTRAAGHHTGEHNCGCAAITGATTLVQEIAAGRTPALHENDGAKAHYVHAIATPIAARAKADAETNGVPLHDWNRFSLCVLRASVLHTLSMIEAIENDPANRHGLPPRPIFGCYLDNRTGDLTVCTRPAANKWELYRAPSLRKVERQFQALAYGKTPHRRAGKNKLRNAKHGA